MLFLSISLSPSYDHDHRATVDVYPFDTANKAHKRSVTITLNWYQVNVFFQLQVERHSSTGKSTAASLSLNRSTCGTPYFFGWLQSYKKWLQEENNAGILHECTLTHTHTRSCTHAAHTHTLVHAPTVCVRTYTLVQAHIPHSHTLGQWAYDTYAKLCS